MNTVGAASGREQCLRIFFVTVLVLLSSTISYAQKTPESLFAEGNAYYEKGEYSEAITEYQKILDSGYESEGIYYNIGNSFFRMGKTGRAILNYERAKRLMPRDADINANYRFAKAEVKGKNIVEKGLWAWRPLRRYYNNFTVNELTWISEAGYVILIVLLLMVMLLPAQKRRLGLIAGVILLGVLLNSFILWHEAAGFEKDSVVVMPSEDVRFGPFESATKFFTLYEGMTVSVLKCKDGWCKIRRADGKVGWIKSDSVEKI